MKRALPILTFLLLTVFTGRAEKLHLNVTESIQLLANAKHDTIKIRVLNTLTEYYLKSKPDSAKWFNQQALVLLQKHDWENKFALPYYYQGSLYRKDKEYNRALKRVQKALGIAKEQKNLTLQSKCYLLLCGIYSDSGNKKQALENGLNGLTIARKQHDPKALLSALMSLGNFYKSNNDVTNGLQYYLEALKLSEKLKDNESEFACCINLGTLYERTNDQNKALDFYNHAVYLNTLTQEADGFAIAYYKLGMLYLKDKQNDSALKFLTQVYHIHTKENNQAGLVRSCSSLGGLYALIGNMAECINYYEQAKKAAIRAKDTLGYGNGILGIAKGYAVNKEYNKSINHYLEGLTYIRRFMTADSWQSYYGNLSEAYAGNKDFVNAYKTHVLFNYYKDSVLASNDTKKQTEIKLGYEFSKVESKLKEEAKHLEVQSAIERQKENTKRNLLLGGIGALILVLLVVTKNIIDKQKANKQLAIQKDQIEIQKKLVEEKNHEIEDSINYAHKIQSVTLPQNQQLTKIFPNHFLLFRPKDIVSGDFYWAAQKNNLRFLAVADCTGHGVPGAIMSMIGSMILNEVFYVKNIYHPADMLKELNRVVKLTLRQEDDTENRDGMDLCLICYNQTNQTLTYSGANRPLYFYSAKHGFTELKATKQGIGGHTPLNAEFNSEEILVENGDRIYLTSDGYADQFGGEKTKKITTKQLKQLLADSSTLPVALQKEKITQFLDKWKGHTEQTDDILLAGISFAE